MAIHPHSHKIPTGRWNIDLFAYWLEVRRMMSLLYYPGILSHLLRLVKHFFSGFFVDISRKQSIMIHSIE